MSIDKDEVTLEIVKNSVIVYRNRKYYGSIGAPDVVKAFIDQDEIVLQYYNPRTSTQRFQTFNLRLRSIRSGGGKYYKPNPRVRQRSSTNSDSGVGHSRSSGVLGAGLGFFLLVLVLAFSSLRSPNTSSPSFEDGMEAHRPDEYSGADSVSELSELRPLTEFTDAFLGTMVIADDAYHTYHNQRFGYSIAYPKDIVYPQGESDNGDGQKFVSKDGGAILIVYGSNNALNQSLEELYLEESRGGTQQNPTKVVTYKVLKKGWFVVSGYNSGNVFYQKTILNNDQFKTFSFIYPESKKHIYDPITKYIAHSFED